LGRTQDVKDQFNEIIEGRLLADDMKFERMKVIQIVCCLTVIPTYETGWINSPLSNM
jgi:hypothetical protein